MKATSLDFNCVFIPLGFHN